MQQSKVTLPKIQFWTEPKSSLPLPPPKEFAPTDNSENPMAVTTLADTIGAISFSQYFANKPKMPSIIPPMRTVPIIAP